MLPLSRVQSRGEQCRREALETLRALCAANDRGRVRVKGKFNRITVGDAQVASRWTVYDT